MLRNDPNASRYFELNSRRANAASSSARTKRSASVSSAADSTSAALDEPRIRGPKRHAPAPTGRDRPALSAVPAPPPPTPSCRARRKRCARTPSATPRVHAAPPGPRGLLHRDRPPGSVAAPLPSSAVRSTVPAEFLRDLRSLRTPQPSGPSASPFSLSGPQLRLQSTVQRNRGRHTRKLAYQRPDDETMLSVTKPGWRNGKRRGLKIPRASALVGSNPTPGMKLPWRGRSVCPGAIRSRGTLRIR